MKIIVSGRRAGKTHKLIEWVRGGTTTTWSPFNTRVLIVHDEANRAYLIQHYGLKKTQVYSWQGWRNVHLGIRSQPEVMIDNVDMLLQNMLGPQSSLKGVTMTGEAEILHGGS